MSFPPRATTLVLIATLLNPHAGQASRLVTFQPKGSEVSEQIFLQVRATVSNRGALVQWQPAIEATTLGFNVFRVPNGQRIQINSSLIAGSALITRERTQSYSWLDTAGTVDCEYVVEAIDLHGETVASGSALPVWRARLPEFKQSPTLSNPGKQADFIFSKKISD